MIVRPYGDTALLVEVDEPAALAGLRSALTGRVGVEEIVPAARTLLVRFDARKTTADVLTQALAGARSRPERPPSGRPVELKVRYDGADLDDVAAAVGCSVPALIDRHAAGQYTVAFCGFAPGFAYLTGLDPALHVARLPSPRARVPAGSVAIADEYTGVYPRSSPGGWRLLGHTDAPLWDLDRTPPALLSPGTSVRFYAR
ncbi:MAG: allophanate hydrolase subunit 1 [Jatrophihabitantaceae bacterium]